jgi:hypothetical protein
MAKASRTAILAACCFLAPFAVFVGLFAIGTFTGYVFTTSILILIFICFGLLIGLALSLIQKYRVKALILVCSVLLIAVGCWHFDEYPFRRFLYVAEVMTTPHFDKKCLPQDGVQLNGDTLRLCATQILISLAGSI